MFNAWSAMKYLATKSSCLVKCPHHNLTVKCLKKFQTVRTYYLSMVGSQCDQIKIAKCL